MRICPKCNHIDGYEWRPAAFLPHIDYAYIESLAATDKELYDILQITPAGKLLYRKPFVYWKSNRSNTVRRSWEKDFEIYGKTEAQDRSDKKNPSPNELYVGKKTNKQP